MITILTPHLKINNSRDLITFSTTKPLVDVPILQLDSNSVTYGFKGYAPKVLTLDNEATMIEELPDLYKTVLARYFTNQSPSNITWSPKHFQVFNNKESWFYMPFSEEFELDNRYVKKLTFSVDTVEESFPFFKKHMDTLVKMRKPKKISLAEVIGMCTELLNTGVLSTEPGSEVNVYDDGSYKVIN